ncbi:hypothetical protein [Micromonospora sp. KLBMP9576]|uniref:hypothetical protein n=1 Tax=Micromonospora sp. KLBMP9576 TaxID=3424769 RepID=UPI003D8E546B
MPWTPPGPARDQEPPALAARPLDPLPDRLTLSGPGRARGRRLPQVRLLLCLVLLAGNPWSVRLITDWRYELPRGPGPSGLLGALGEVFLLAASWPRWEFRPVRSELLAWWLAENARTVLFVAITAALLRRLDTQSLAPQRAYRVLGVIGASVTGAVLAAVGAVVLHMATDSGGLRGVNLTATVLETLTGAMFCGLGFGALLAWASVRRPGPRREDVAATWLGGG